MIIPASPRLLHQKVKTSQTGGFERCHLVWGKKWWVGHSGSLTRWQSQCPAEETQNDLEPGFRWLAKYKVMCCKYMWAWGRWRQANGKGVGHGSPLGQADQPGSEHRERAGGRSIVRMLFDVLCTYSSDPSRDTATQIIFLLLFPTLFNFGQSPAWSASAENSPQNKSLT